jgi:uncharacterized membrane-anchored protein
MIAVPSLDGVTARVPVLWRALVAMLVLCGLILLVVESRARILRSGVEIRLKTAPVDPRDLFRGDYVVLGYEIGTIELAGLDGDKAFRRGDAVHVRLGADAEGFAVVRGIYRARPAGSGTVIAGRVSSTVACRFGEDGASDCGEAGARLRVDYGLESYFVPQGSGLAIERTERKRIEIVAAVSSSGEAAIKRLLIDGKLVHAEPPY